MTTTAGGKTAFLPAPVRHCIWYLTDRDYRTQAKHYRQRAARISAAQRRLSRLIWRIGKGTVLSGPFEGMQYIRKSGRQHFTQKLLGTYEKELWPVIDEIIASNYQHIVDIGAAEGYYVAGLARMDPSARVTAFEAQAQCHPLIKQLACLNGVEHRVDVKGLCERHDLSAALGSGISTLVICDIEGAEFELLDPKSIPGGATPFYGQHC